MRTKIVLFFCSLLLLVSCSSSSTLQRIARDPSWASLSFDIALDNVNAFTTALVQEIAKAERLSIEIIDVDSINLLNWLQQGKYIGALSSLAPLPEYRELYDFSEPILPLGPVLIVPIHSPVRTLGDLRGKHLGVYAFDESTLIAQKEASVVIDLYQNIPTALDATLTGIYDGILVPNLTAQQLIPTRYANQLKIVTPPLNDLAIRLLTQKKGPFLASFNKGLERLKASSRYLALQKKFLF